MKLCRIVIAQDGRVRQFRQGMADESRVNPALAIKLLLKRKNHQSLVDVVAQQAHASLSPCPELRRHIIDRRNAALLHLTGNPPVERRGIDNDGEIRLALDRFFDQMPLEAENLREMAENLGDADNRKILAVDNSLAAGRPDGISAHAEELKPTLRVSRSFLRGDSRPRLSGGAKLRLLSLGSPPQSFHQLRPVHFPR